MEILEQHKVCKETEIYNMITNYRDYHLAKKAKQIGPNEVLMFCFFAKQTKILKFS